MSESKVSLDFNPSTTIKIKTGCTHLYVTITNRNVFFFTGKVGGCQFSNTEALGRLATLVLEKGGTLEEIQKQLQGIRCPSPHCPTGKVEDEVLSCADGISRAIGVYLKDRKEGDLR
jgi:ribonucleoside-diphosphate reductase alpha chain